MQRSWQRRESLFAAGLLVAFATMACSWLLAAGRLSTEVPAEHAHHSAHGASLPSVLIMGVAMMATMMLPVVAPALVRQWLSRGTSVSRHLFATASFLIGYLVPWAAFGAVATLAQFALSSTHAWSALQRVDIARLEGLTLVIAGSFQLTGAKRASLFRLAQANACTECTPGGRRSGASLKEGLETGVNCLACCWALMLLMYVGHAMNLIVMMALSGYILLERMLRPESRLSRAVGVVLVSCGIGVVAWPH